MTPGIKHPLTLLTGFFLVAPLFLEIPATAAPVTFNTALPVSRGEYVWREQLVLRRSGEDPSGLDRDLSVDHLVSVIGYGVTPRFALFGVLPYSDRSLRISSSDSAPNRSNSGLSDPTIFGRYTVFQHDGPGRTLRAAAIAGLKAPLNSGVKRDALGALPSPLQLGTGAWDGFGGVVVTYQTLDFELDGQVLLRRNGSSGGVNFGDEFRLDGSFQYRLWPGEIAGGVPGFVYGIIEANWVRQGHHRGPGGRDVNSGGKTLTVSPGLQYVTKRYILEAAVQIPVYQHLNGTGLENDYVVRAGFRVNF